MKLLLIAPASGRWQHIGRKSLFGGKAFRFSLLSLLSVAAVTPEDWEVSIVDEQVEEIPLDDRADLVGITCMTALAPRAYEIADHFRARGIPVVLGGMHPTFLPEEGLEHADAVIAGDVENVWDTVLADLAMGRLSGIYRAGNPPSLAGLKPVPRHLLNNRKYATVQAILATRGCKHHCGFCSIAAYSRSTQRARPVDEVVAEIRSLSDRFIIFVDDNLTADRVYALSLFRALRPLGKLWITQGTLQIAGDAELLDAAAEAGCFGIFAGLETVSQAALRSVRKNFNRVDGYHAAIEALHSRGIGIEAGLVFGLDGHGPGIFEETLRAVDDLCIDAVQVSIATPLPGTALFAEWQDRIIDRNWSHYDLHSVVFRPRGMSAKDLQAGHDWFTREFYRPWRMARRVARWVRRPRGWQTLRYMVGLNLGYYGRVRRWGLAGYNPMTVPGHLETPQATTPPGKSDTPHPGSPLPSCVDSAVSP